jgi:hypothetical protein
VGNSRSQPGAAASHASGGVPYRHKYWIHPYNAPCSLPNSPMLMGPSFAYAYAYALSDPPVSEFQARVRMAESAARKSVEYLDPHVFATCLLVLGAHVSCVPEIVRKERQKPQNRASRETGATAVPFSAILRSSPSLPPSLPAGVSEWSRGQHPRHRVGGKMAAAWRGPPRVSWRWPSSWWASRRPPPPCARSSRRRPPVDELMRIWYQTVSPSSKPISII